MYLGHRIGRREDTRGVSSVASVFLCVLCVSALPTQAQTLYKCVQASGRVQYQQEPCVDAKKQSTVRPPDPVAPKSEEQLKAAAEQAAQGAQRRMEQVIAVMADTGLCIDVPGFEAKHTAAIRQWSARNREMVIKYDTDDGARAQADARTSAERARLGPDPRSLAEYCERFVARLGAPAPAAPKK
ncbi:DUF4124 domain-containing protein [Pseudomonas sp.]|uniref:DUF4124 domain-containing protein n=1 Tax=Pseudomonas sp. TaxID=306 RepID=UPI002CDC2F5C|nr:DUF4124 domain-containing protein [Pseudomonas sp.]HUE94469.1 DUF4124 domain-containing protein [Pseudomonas sp.]